MVKDETMETEAVFKDNKNPNQTKTNPPQKKQKKPRQKKKAKKKNILV